MDAPKPGGSDALPTTRIGATDIEQAISSLPSDFPIAPDMLRFKTFTGPHAVALAVCTVLIAAVVVAGRRLRREPFGGARTSRDARVRSGILVDPAGQMLGAIGIIMWLSWQLWWFAPAQFKWTSSLPLHICDLAGLVAALALMTGSRLLTTVLVFWGLGLSTQAYATPVVRIGPGATEFWIFWESHTFIIGSAVYCIAVRGYRAGVRDLRNIVLVTFAYLGVMLPLDVLTGWNYGYVGNAAPETETLIDKLGPWPWRLVPLALIVNGVYLVVWLGFVIGARRENDSAGD